MKKVIILTIILLSTQSFATNINFNFEAIPFDYQELDIDKAGKQIKAKTSSLRKLINKKVQRSLFKATEELLVDIVKTASGVYYEQMGKDVVKGLYEDLSDEQVNVLNFFILSRVASELDRKNFLAEEDSLRLELYRDRRDKLFATLLAAIKKIADVPEASIKSIK